MKKARGGDDLDAYDFRRSRERKQLLKMSFRLLDLASLLSKLEANNPNSEEENADSWLLQRSRKRNNKNLTASTSLQ